MEKVEIKILGHSGCTVEIVENFGDVCIRKATVDQNYMVRLHAQIAKQKSFSKLFSSVSVPEVYSEYQSPRVYFAEMQYIPALDIFSFVSIASKDDLDKFFNILEGYLKESLSLSKMTEFPLTNITNKLDQLEADLTNKLPKAVSYIHRLKHILKQNVFPPIPIGFCHGDLTFSNILIEPDCENIYLIDFLDSFLESPIQDIVKIKQDVVYHWSTQKAAQTFDICRARITFSYLNKRLDDFIAAHAINNAVVCLIQTINLMRILPYTSDVELINYLFTCIDNELKNLESYL
ncbi:MAG: phosphotransferase [Methylophilus sp.]|nr:phosphotransferase [Methylophilus sp.]